MRKSTTESRLGPKDSRAKTFTVSIEVPKLRAIIFCQMKDQETSATILFMNSQDTEMLNNEYWTEKKRVCM